jgi:hypothetical protein
MVRFFIKLRMVINVVSILPCCMNTWKKYNNWIVDNFMFEYNVNQGNEIDFSVFLGECISAL